jgi:hypothetical protein
VLEQTPGRVRQFGRLGAAQFGRQSGQRLLEIEVRVAATQQIEQVLAQRAMGSPFYLGPDARF